MTGRARIGLPRIFIFFPYIQCASPLDEARGRSHIVPRRKANRLAFLSARLGEKERATSISLLKEDVRMRQFDLTPLYRSTIGFDRLGSLLDTLTAFEGDAPSYPPYNIERVGENEYRISMAVAGFADKDLNIEVKENTLSIRGEKKTEVENTTCLHRGIASRSFERRFQLADHVVVKGASLENGLLHVDLVRELPEAMKPRTIAIKTKTEKAETPKVIDSKAA
jgi:molecular chaperone IbpA